MATTTMKKAIRYIDDTHAQVTKAFEKKSCIFGTDEFQEWRAYKAMFPKEGVLSPLLEVIDVLANHIFRDLVYAINF